MDKDLDLLNKEVAEWLGLCWHEIVSQQPYELDGVEVGSLFRCSCGSDLHGESVAWHLQLSNPDFVKHPEQLLRLMCKREDWGGDDGFQQQLTCCDSYSCIDPDYITDTTGLLLRKVGEFMRRGK
jgi:hypothetical protein